MRSITFTKMKKKLLNNEKRQTIRLKFIPQFIENEVIKIFFKENNEKIFLFYAKVKKIFPLKVKEITNEIARLDGFQDKNECIQKLLEINKINKSKGLEQYCFVIRFEKIDNKIDFY
ncbi:MAG: ASCH domain-containing protein [Candidatus Helarchaeota archaeon]